MTHPADFAEAQKVVKARIGFYIHVVIFLIVNAILVGVNLSTTPGRLWFPWPLFGWGVGVAAHALGVFWLPGLRDRMVDKEMKKRS